MKIMSQVLLPNQFSQMLTICRYELLKSLRGKKVLGILSITIGVSLFLILVPELMGTDPPNSVTEFLILPLSSVFFIIVISAAFFGSGSLVSEFHERTGYSLFINPVSRETIWFGKFLSAEMLSFLAIGIFYGIISGGAFLTYGELPSELLQSFAFSLFTITMLTSFAFFVSSISRGPTSAAVIVFLLFILVLPLVDQFLMNFAELKPWFTPTFAKGIIDFVLFDPYPIDVAPGELPRGPNDYHRFVPYVDESIMILAGYIVTFCLASIWFFRRKEMIN